MAKSFDLFTPGPVNLSREAREALGEPVLYHRSEAFQRIWADLASDLKTAFATQDQVMVLTASGTGAMEAVVANLFSPGDQVLVPTNGKFSMRWAEICEAYGVRAVRMDLRPGESPAPDCVGDALARVGPTKAVFLTQCETSTGSLTDLRSVSRAIHDFESRRGHSIIVCSDSTTSFCVDELRKDAWGVDVVVAASQKGMLCPPGLSFVSLSARARKLAEEAKASRYYFDFRKYLDSGRPPFTPAVSLVSAAGKSLKRILTLGLEDVWKANRAASRALRLIVETAGLRPVAQNQSAAVVAFWVGDLSAEEIVRILREDHGIVIAHGQGELRGKILRVSGIGKPPSEIRLFAGAFETTLAGLGRRCDIKGIADPLKMIMEDARLWE